MPRLLAQDVPAKPNTTTVLLFCGLSVLFLGLSAFYGSRFPRMVTQYDVWFRTDVNHYVAWVREPGAVYRAFLHPATLFLLKPYCLLIGRFLPLQGAILPLYALPVVLFHAALLTRFLTRFSQSPLLLALALVLLVGPLLLLAPIPESHTLGGLALLMETLAVWQGTGSRGQGAEGRTPNTNHRTPITEHQPLAPFFWGLLATGFSLSNLIPALIIAFPLIRRIPFRRWQVFAAMGSGIGLLLLGLIQIFVRFQKESDEWGGNFLAFAASRFTYWVKLPDATAFFRSLRALVMAQFGVPETAVFNYTSEIGFQYNGVILRDGINVLQSLAALCWLLAVLWQLFRLRKETGLPCIAERSLIETCLAALLWLVGFHSFFASDEAFMFSVHAWPFVVFPLLLLLQPQPGRNRGTLILAILCLILSLVQTILAFPRLFSLPI